MPTPDEIVAAAMAGQRAVKTETPYPSGSDWVNAETLSRQPEVSLSRDEKFDPPLSKDEKLLYESLLGSYTAIEMGLYLVDGFAAQCISNQKVQATDAWLTLSRRDPKVKALLKKLTSGSAWGGVIMAHAAVLIPIFAKLGFIPGGALLPSLFNNSFEQVVTNPIPMPAATPDSDAQAVADNGSVTF